MKIQSGRTLALLRVVPCSFAPSSLTLVLPVVLSITLAAPSQSWNRRALTTNPPPRTDHATAIEFGTGDVLLFGGINASGELADTWTFDGSRWLSRSPAVSPPARSQSALATDTIRGVSVLFDGSSQLNDTWEWNGTTWVPVTPAASPPVRQKHQMAFDPILGVVVLFGGEAATGSLNDTWTYGGTTWTQVITPATPPARENATLEFDPILGRVVLFGGHGRVGMGSYWLQDTWSFTGTTWVNHVTVNLPATREDHAMAFDGVRGTLVVTSGYVDPTGNTADQWEWNRVNWASTTPARMPGARRSHSMDYGPRGELIMFAGVGGGARLDETWTVGTVMPYGANVPVYYDPATPGCPSPQANPKLTSDTAPVLGTNLVLDLAQFDPAVPVAVLSLGFVYAPAPCPSFGHVSAGSYVVTTVGGSGSQTIPIPNNPSLAGTATYAQAVSVDSFGLLVLTNQVNMVLGF